MATELNCGADNPVLRTTPAESPARAQAVEETYSEMAYRYYRNTRDWLFGSSSPPQPARDQVSLPGLTVGDSADDTDRVLVEKNGRTHRAYWQARQASVALGTGGSGFFVDKDGTIMTASHAVPVGSDVISVTLADGSFRTAKFVARDENNNLAMLKIENNGKAVEYPFLPLNPLPPYGEAIAAIGHPKAWADIYISMGIAEKEPVKVDHNLWRRSDAVVRMGAHVEPGNSGGAVVDGCGYVRGVAVGQQGEALALVIPSKAVANLIEWTGKHANSKVMREGGYHLAITEQSKKWTPDSEIKPPIAEKLPKVPDTAQKPQPEGRRQPEGNYRTFESPYGKVFNKQPAPYYENKGETPYKGNMKQDYYDRSRGFDLSKNPFGSTEEQLKQLEKKPN